MLHSALVYQLATEFCRYMIVVNEESGGTLGVLITDDVVEWKERWNVKNNTTKHDSRKQKHQTCHKHATAS